MSFFDNNKEYIILRYLMYNPSMWKLAETSYFKDKEVGILAKAVKDEYDSNGTIFTKNILKQVVGDKALYQNVDNLFEITEADTKQPWVEKLVKAFIVWNNFDKSMSKAVLKLKDSNINIYDVADVVDGVVDEITKCRNIRFDTDLGLRLTDPTCHQKRKEHFKSSPWDFINRYVGGWENGTLSIYAGESNIGKSIYLCHEAVSAVLNGENVAYITLEMSEDQCLARMGTNLFDMTRAEYDDEIGNNRDKFVRAVQLASASSIIPWGETFVKQMPTACTTAVDIENYVLELEKTYNVKIDKVIIDYVNIMSDGVKANASNLYLKVKNICEQLRAVAIRLHVPVISATQVNRSGFGEATLSMDSISESAGLIHTADNLLTITQTNEMNLANYYFLGCLKCRTGNGNGSAKNKQVNINVNYEKMQLIEDITSEQPIL